MEWNVQWMETWTVSKLAKNSLKAVGIWFYKKNVDNNMNRQQAKWRCLERDLLTKRNDYINQKQTIRHLLRMGSRENGISLEWDLVRMWKLEMSWQRKGGKRIGTGKTQRTILANYWTYNCPINHKQPFKWQHPIEHATSYRMQQYIYIYITCIIH